MGSERTGERPRDSVREPDSNNWVGLWDNEDENDNRWGKHPASARCRGSLTIYRPRGRATEPTESAPEYTDARAVAEPPSQGPSPLFAPHTSPPGRRPNRRPGP